MAEGPVHKDFLLQVEVSENLQENNSRPQYRHRFQNQRFRSRVSRLRSQKNQSQDQPLPTSRNICRVRATQKYKNRPKPKSVSPMFQLPSLSLRKYPLKSVPTEGPAQSIIWPL